MRPEASKRSTLHLQMGQETVYLVLTMAVFATVVLSAMLYKTRQPFEDPPIITLAEADGFYFAPGSPAISQDFDRQLRATVVPRLRTIADKYGAYTVEVIGNTDEVPLGPSLRRGSNLDGSLAAWLTERSVENPIAYDNVGLPVPSCAPTTRWRTALTRLTTRHVGASKSAYAAAPVVRGRERFYVRSPSYRPHCGGLFPPGRRSRGPDGSSSGNCGRLSSALPALDYCVARSQRSLSQPQPCRP